MEEAKLPPPKPHSSASTRNIEIGRRRVLHRIADADRRDQQRPGGERGPEPAAEDRHHEGVEDAQRRAREARQRRQPEQLVGGELEADAGSFATTTDQTSQTAKDSSSAGIEIQRLRRAMAAPGRLPEGLVLRAPVGQDRAGQRADVLGLVDLLHFGKLGKLLQRFADDAALHLADRQVHPDERTRDEHEQQHEAARPDAGQVVSTPKAIGSTKPPSPPIMPTRPPTAPTWLG